jgi:hypothetical protein
MWTLFSLLRDNVQHHLEGGMPSGQFPAVHAVAYLIGAGGSVKVSARQIRDEVRWVFGGLRCRPVRELAISIRTAAVLANAWPLPAVRGTTLVRVAGWPVPESLAEATTLGGAFGRIAFDLARITEQATKGDQVSVMADSLAGEANLESALVCRETERPSHSG